MKSLLLAANANNDLYILATLRFLFEWLFSLLLASFIYTDVIAFFEKVILSISCYLHVQIHIFKQE